MSRRKPPKTAQSTGGKARMASMTARKRSDLASKGGRVGGKARAEVLTPERRREIARAAANKRWGDKG